MAKASQIASRTEEATLDIEGISIRVRFYPDRITPHVMRLYTGALAALTMLQMVDISKKSDEEAALSIKSSLEDLEGRVNATVPDLAESACTLLAWWDLEEDIEDCAPGAFVALTPERLIKFGFTFLMKLVEGVLGQVKLMGEVKGAKLNGHSRPTSGAKPRLRR